MMIDLMRTWVQPRVYGGVHVAHLFSCLSCGLCFVCFRPVSCVPDVVFVVVCVLFVFVLYLVYRMLSLECFFWIATSVLSKVYLYYEQNTDVLK